MKNCKLKYRVYATIVDVIILSLGLLIMFYISGTYTLWIDMINGVDILIDSYELLYLIRVLVFELFFIIFYLVMLPSMHNSQTLGMYMFKIQIVNYDNKPANFGVLFTRQFVINILITISTFGISLLLSLCLILYRKDRCSLADLICHTNAVDKLDY